MEQHEEQYLSKKGRIVGLVIAGSMLFWIAAQYIGPRIGLSGRFAICLLYTSPSPRDRQKSRMPSSA